MPRFDDISIKRRLTLIVMLTTSVALLLSCIAFVTYDWISSKEALGRRLETMAEIIGSNSTAALIFDHEQDAIETLAALRAEPDVVSACIYDATGAVFARYHRTNDDFDAPPLEADGHRFTKDHLVLFKEIVVDGPVGAVYIKMKLVEMQHRLTRYVGIVATFILVSSLAAFLVGSRLRESISQPILHLVQRMRQVSEDKNFSVRATKTSRDELGQLVDGFNEMLTQIQDRDAALQQARDELELRASELQTELGERLRAEERIKTSLDEKEILLKEIHHRVKNNLQVISSLLDLQSLHVEDDRAMEMFRDSQNRIESMGLIHERLYQSQDFARIDFDEYIHELVVHLSHSYGVPSNKVTIETKVEKVALDIATAIPCGLIVNELVSNCLKYAFPASAGGMIEVGLRPGSGKGSHVIYVKDNGVGFPDGFDFRRTPSLGLKLVNALVKQLGGQIDLAPRRGTEFKISF